MVIDEDRKYILKKYTKVRGAVKIIESDHNLMWTEINVPWIMKIFKQREEVYNLRSKICQQNFFEFTSNSDMLTKCVIGVDVQHGGKLWLKSLKYAILQNFKKIRISDKQPYKTEVDFIG